MYPRRHGMAADDFVSRYLYQVPGPLRDPIPYDLPPWPHHRRHCRSPRRGHEDPHFNRERDTRLHLRQSLSPSALSDPESLRIPTCLSPPPLRSADSQRSWSGESPFRRYSTNSDVRDPSQASSRQPSLVRDPQRDQKDFYPAVKIVPIDIGDRSDPQNTTNYSVSPDPGFQFQGLKEPADATEEEEQEVDSLASDEGLDADAEDENIDSDSSMPSGPPAFRDNERRPSVPKMAKMVRQKDEVIVQEKISETRTIVTSQGETVSETTKIVEDIEMRSETSELQQSLENYQERREVEQKTKDRQQRQSLQRLQQQQQQLLEIEEQTETIQIEQSQHKLQHQRLKQQLLDIEQQIETLEFEQSDNQRQRHPSETLEIEESIQKLQQQKQLVIQEIEETEIEIEVEEISSSEERRRMQTATQGQEGQTEVGASVSEINVEVEVTEEESMTVTGGQGKGGEEVVITQEEDIVVNEVIEVQGGNEGQQRGRQQRQQNLPPKRVSTRVDNYWWFERHTKLIAASVCCILLLFVVLLCILMIMGVLYFFFGFFGACHGATCSGGAAAAAAVVAPVVSGCSGGCAPRPSCGVVVRRVCAAPPPMDSEWILRRLLWSSEMELTTAGRFYHSCMTSTKDGVADSAAQLLSGIIRNAGGWPMSSQASFSPSWSIVKAWKAGVGAGVAPIIVSDRDRTNTLVLRFMPTPVVPLGSFVELGWRVALRLDSNANRKAVTSHLKKVWRQQRRLQGKRQWSERPQRWRLIDFERHVLRGRVNLKDVLSWELGYRPSSSTELIVLQPTEFHQLVLMKPRELADRTYFHFLAVLLRRLSPPLGAYEVPSRWRHCVRLTEQFCSPPAVVHEEARGLIGILRRHLMRQSFPHGMRLRFVVEPPPQYVAPSKVLTGDFVTDLLALWRFRWQQRLRTHILGAIHITPPALWRFHMHRSHLGLAYGEFGANLAASALARIGGFQHRPCGVIEGHRAILGACLGAFGEKRPPPEEWRHFFAVFAHRRYRHSRHALEAVLSTNPMFAKTYSCERMSAMAAPWTQCFLH